ncbi:MAG: hypothetical protein CMH83_23075 [Nocardioides sp.]|nr:hypothetical protein [Nocardioides sp.]
MVTPPPFAARRTGAWARSWWGKAWVRALEEAAYDDGDLRVARTIARSGRIGGLSLTAGRVVAAVGDDRGLWTVDLGVPVLDAASVEALVEVVVAQAGRLPMLLAGDLPHDLVEEAEEHGVELLPYGGELAATCTCDAWADPCPHALAVGLQVTWLVDDDPLALVHLRGLGREDLVARTHRTRPVEAVPTGTGGRTGRPVREHADDEEDEALLDLAEEAAARAAAWLAGLDGGGADDLVL